MQSLTRPASALAAFASVSLAVLGCDAPAASRSVAAEPIEADAPISAAALRITSPANTPRPPFNFSAEDEALLDEIQHATFMYFWKAVNPRTGMVPDRSSVTFISVAGVGFQLSALPIGVERGWITKAQGAERALTILKSLRDGKNNRHEGLFQHYLDGDTAGPRADSPEHVVSTIDSALLFVGMLTAGSYFGGEVRQIGDELVAAANWKAFVSGNEAKPHERGFISLGWAPPTKKFPAPRYLPYYWADSGCEHRLVTIMGVIAPRDEYRVDPAMYYRLRRAPGDYKGTGPMIWFPFSGALFVNIFSHCWVDYAAMGVDNPAAFKVENRSPVDWWENSRRLVAMHRLKARENPERKPTLGEHAWGLSAMDVIDGYAVPGVYPNLLKLPGMRPEFDYSTFTPKDDYGDGSIAVYAPGASIMFEPKAAIDVLRHTRNLQAPNGSPLVWRDPSRSPEAGGGYGFRDSYNLGTGWVAPDYVAIDQGPLLLAIENARTGLIWRTFHAHPWVQEAGTRLGWPKVP